MYNKVVMIGNLTRDIELLALVFVVVFEFLGYLIGF